MPPKIIAPFRGADAGSVQENIKIDYTFHHFVVLSLVVTVACPRTTVGISFVK